MVASFGEESLGEEDASEQGRKIDDIDEGVTLVDETAENQRRFNDEEMFDAGVLDCEEVFANAEQEVAAVKEVTTAGIEKVVSTAEVTTVGIEVTTAGIEVTTASATTTTVNDLTLAQTLMEIRSKGIMVEPKMPTKRKVQIRLDEEAAQRLQAELQAELEEEKRLRKMTQKKQNLKTVWEIILDKEEITIDVVPLVVKSPSIVDWKVAKDGKKSYYQIIRADGSFKMYCWEL
ncbi:hypothetical protein Tco_0906965 [Tanacetum coccineum]|uniref:Uncharacterized protein n=1 Tax=Tanacetum coccineum TaxID=301880 RepID=A0ABQ5CI98_9ASTR